MAEPWYRDGLRFSCRRCGDCCRGAPGYVWIDEHEIDAAARFLEISVRRFHKRYIRSVDGRYSLIEYPNGDCIFYDDGCVIYPVRPVQCWTFPFWPEYMQSSETWSLAALRCPAVGKGNLRSCEEIDRCLKAFNK